MVDKESLLSEIERKFRPTTGYGAPLSEDRKPHHLSKDKVGFRSTGRHGESYPKALIYRRGDKYVKKYPAYGDKEHEYDSLKDALDGVHGGTSIWHPKEDPQMASGGEVSEHRGDRPQRKSKK